MRNLQSTDIFAFCRVVNAIGIKEEIKDIAMKANSLKDIASREDLGFDLIFAVFEKATTKGAEDQLFEFISGLAEMPAEELKAMDPCDFIELILQIANVEKWKAFFSSVAKLMKSK